MPSRYPLIAVVGPVGIGKSTFVELLAKSIKITQFEEPYLENPHLKDFYTDNPANHSFDCQMFFMENDGVQSKKISELLKNNPVFKDAGKEINFLIASVQRKMGWMTKGEYSTYLSAYKKIYRGVPEPDIFIALKAAKKTVIERIIRRGRKMELVMHKKFPKYFPTLVKEYDAWLAEKQKDGRTKIAVVDTDKFDFFKNGKQREEIVKETLNRFSYLRINGGV